MQMTPRMTALVASVVSVVALAVPALASAKKHRSSIPTGYYQCYETRQDISPITGAISYSTGFVKSFTLFKNHTYNVPLEGLFDRDNRWKFAAGKLRFRSGPMWSGFRHAVGSYKKAGKLMPNSQLNPTRHYPLVLRDAKTNDSDALPHTETANASLWYCKRG